MNDDALHPDLELASAALDGDVSADERARLEADPEATALLAELTAVRARLADAPPVEGAVREAALAAALAEFDSLAALDEPAEQLAAGTPTAAGAPAGGATVLSFFRRRSTVILGAAAAVVLAGVIGITALGGSNRDVSTTESAEKELGLPAATEAAAEMAPAEAPASTISGISGPASAPIPVNDGAALLALAQEMAMTYTAGDDADGSAGGGTPSASTTMPVANTMAPADTIATAASDAPMVVGAEDMATRFAYPCPLTGSQVVLADILWVGVPAFAVLDTSTGVVSAVGTDCTVLVTVAP